MAKRHKFRFKPQNKKYGNWNKPVNKQIKSRQKTKSSFAYAPYNFVPLNMSVVEAEPLPDHDRYYSDRYTGYIDCLMETLTPVYIRGCLTADEFRAGQKVNQNSDFFSPAGQVRIPGSSLRGMVRSLIEIVSWSRFGFFEDRHLYYRSFADVSSVAYEYKKNMNPDQSGSSVYNMSAGYLVKTGSQYCIHPSEGRQFDRISKDEAELKTGNKVKNNYYYELDDGSSLVVSGSMHNKKNDWIVFHKDDSEKKIIISDADIQNYIMDTDRSSSAPNLIEMCKHHEVPCFYVLWKDQEGNSRVSFGHTALFRIAYKKSIGEHIPPEHHENTIDTAHAIFGMIGNKNNSFAGRVFFEDATLTDQYADPVLDEKIAKILLGPKPTAFQLYLEQNSTDPKKLKHYNSDNAWIRGNKLYWHTSGKNWEKADQKPENFNKNIETRIKPVMPHTKFRFGIRFENLSKIELGSLLFTLKLPEGCAHKIGMGKPIGLGTVQIKTTLYISDRKERYSKLFEDSDWIRAETENSDSSIQTFINDFSRYILRNMSDIERGNATSLWDTYRLQQLRLLLDVGRSMELEKEGTIKYMKLEDFRHRNVLPVPEQV